jgi:lipoprotein-releasing system ATP-binding protein
VSISSTPALHAEGVTKSYQLGKRTIDVLRGIDLHVDPGEFISVVGPSGAGKSTLLHILGTLERPTAGSLALNGRDTATLDDEQLAILRREAVGFVFQFHHLLPAFSALENVMMPQLVRGASRKEAEGPAQALLEQLGVGHRLENKPSELSGGEQQRVAVARAMVNNPRVLLADEPTGNLDRGTGVQLEQDLVAFTRDRGASVVVVTHNEDWAAKADRVVRIVDGSIKERG